MEIKQLYPGPMALNPFIESHLVYMVFPLSDDFIIGNRHFRLKHKRNFRNSSKLIGICKRPVVRSGAFVAVFMLEKT